MDGGEKGGENLREVLRLMKLLLLQKQRHRLKSLNENDEKHEELLLLANYLLLDLVTYYVQNNVDHH